MKAIGLNKASFVLSLIGLFISGVLSLGHIMNVTPPCSAESECTKVTTSQYAYWANIPVAYFGFLAYAVLAYLALTRFSKGLEGARKAAKAGLIVSGAGAAFSAWFMYASFGILGARCDWCLSSAVTMFLLLGVHLMMNKAVAPEQEIPKGVQPGIGFGMALGGFCVLVFGLMFQGMELGKQPPMTKNLARATSDELATKVLEGVRNFKGPKDAPVTVVEFLDFYCPACRESYASVMELTQNYPNTLRIGYRHYPLMDKPGHENALLAAVLSEYAGEKGKFWEFVGSIMSANLEDLTDKEALFGLLGMLGLDRAEVEKRMVTPEDKLVTDVQADLALANDAGLVFTPTFYIVAKGLPTKIVGASELKATLESKEYMALLAPVGGSGPLAPGNPALEQQQELPEGHSADDGHNH